MSCHSSFQSKEKTLASNLDISTISMSKHKEESSGRRSWCLRDPLRIQSYLHRLELIWEHPYQRYVTLFFISMVSMVFLLFINTCSSIVIDLESLRLISMHPTQFGAQKWSNPGFPTTSIKALGQVLASQSCSKVC